MRILVTNGSTYLSRAVATTLSSQHKVTLTDRLNTTTGPSSLEYFHNELGHDRSTTQLVRNMDVIIHSGEPNPDDTVSKQLDGTMRCTYNLLWAATEARVPRIIYLSSMSIMSGYSEDLTVTETWRPKPGTKTRSICYHLGEYVCREFGRAGGLDVISLRLGDIVADGEDNTSTSVLYTNDAIEAIQKTLAFIDGEKEPASGQPVRRPSWSVFHIQSEVPNARYIYKAAQEVLGYEPAARISG